MLRLKVKRPGFNYNIINDQLILIVKPLECFELLLDEIKIYLRLSLQRVYLGTAAPCGEVITTDVG